MKKIFYFIIAFASLIDITLSQAANHKKAQHFNSTQNIQQNPLNKTANKTTIPSCDKNKTKWFDFAQKAKMNHPEYISHTKQLISYDDPSKKIGYSYWVSLHPNWARKNWNLQCVNSKDNTVVNCMCLSHLFLTETPETFLALRKGSDLSYVNQVLSFAEFSNQCFQYKSNEGHYFHPNQIKITLNHLFLSLEPGSTQNYEFNSLIHMMALQVHRNKDNINSGWIVFYDPSLTFSYQVTEIYDINELSRSEFKIKKKNNHIDENKNLFNLFCMTKAHKELISDPSAHCLLNTSMTFHENPSTVNVVDPFDHDVAYLLLENGHYGDDNPSYDLSNIRLIDLNPKMIFFAEDEDYSKSIRYFMKHFTQLVKSKNIFTKCEKKRICNILLGRINNKYIGFFKLYLNNNLELLNELLPIITHLIPLLKLSKKMESDFFNSLLYSDNTKNLLMKICEDDNWNSLDCLLTHLIPFCIKNIENRTSVKIKILQELLNPSCLSVAYEKGSANLLNIFLKHFIPLLSEKNAFRSQIFNILFDMSPGHSGLDLAIQYGYPEMVEVIFTYLKQLNCLDSSEKKHLYNFLKNQISQGFSELSKQNNKMKTRAQASKYSKILTILTSHLNELKLKKILSSQQVKHLLSFYDKTD